MAMPFTAPDLDPIWTLPPLPAQNWVDVVASLRACVSFSPPSTLLMTSEKRDLLPGVVGTLFHKPPSNTFLFPRQVFEFESATCRALVDSDCK
jgi:hypothetical protein